MEIYRVLWCAKDAKEDGILEPYEGLLWEIHGVVVVCRIL